jgi:hypothetical protein
MAKEQETTAKKKVKLINPNTYWSKLEQDGCCPMMFSAYKRFKKNPDV